MSGLGAAAAPNTPTPRDAAAAAASPRTQQMLGALRDEMHTQMESEVARLREATVAEKASTLRQQQLLEEQNRVLMEQVAQMQALMQQQQMSLQQFSQKFPIPENEAERRIVLRRTNLMAMTLPNAGLDGAVTRALVAVEKLGPLREVMFNVIGEQRQRMAAMAFRLRDGRVMTTRELPDMLVNAPDEQMTNRKYSACQYVVGTGEMQCFNGDSRTESVRDGVATGGGYDLFDQRKLDIAASGLYAADEGLKNDAMVASALTYLAEAKHSADGSAAEWLEGAPGRAMLAAMGGDFREWFEFLLRLTKMGDGETMTYAGVPVRCEGVVLGSLCFMYDGLPGDQEPTPEMNEAMRKQGEHLSSTISSILGLVDVADLT